MEKDGGIRKAARPAELLQQTSAGLKTCEKAPVKTLGCPFEPSILWRTAPDVKDGVEETHQSITCLSVIARED